MTDAQDRYSTSGLIEAEAEPGSNGEVLRNLQGITTRHEMEFVETFELICTTEGAIDSFGPDHRFSTADICGLHRQWLGSIYPWAGQYRQVMLSKGGFPFAAPAHIPASQCRCFEIGPFKITNCDLKVHAMSVAGRAAGE